MRYKPLILFCALLVPPLIIFSGEISRALEMRDIKRDAAFTAASSAELVVVESRKSNRQPTYLVKYKFPANGNEYVAVTTPTDRVGAMRYLSEPTTQIVYSAKNPSLNTLKRFTI